MKIVHIADCYIDGWGYQENLLPQYQIRNGHDVVVVADNDHLKYLNNPTLAQTILNRGLDYENDGIRVYKIKEYLTTSSTSLICQGLYKVLEKEAPNMIFHHNLNTSTLLVAARYKRKHPQVKLYVDNHADWVNESKNKLWHKVFYDTLIPWTVKRLGDLVNYYLGVSPLRCQYLNTVFRVPEEKIKFFPIGCDTAGAEQVKESRDELRKLYQIKSDAFVVVSGGKLDRSKGTLALIEACNRIKSEIASLQLVLFGKVDEEVKQVANGKSWIKMEGWCDRKKTLSLLKLSDVACWPLLHTTLIEDSVASCVPLVVKMSDNVSHFYKEMTGVFLKKGDVEELMEALLEINTNSKQYQLNVEKARDKYCYSTLVKCLDAETFYEW